MLFDSFRLLRLLYCFLLCLTIDRLSFPISQDDRCNPSSIFASVDRSFLVGSSSHLCHHFLSYAIVTEREAFRRGGEMSWSRSTPCLRHFVSIYQRLGSSAPLTLAAIALHDDNISSSRPSQKISYKSCIVCSRSLSHC